ncbi:unnamed protein product [Calypogeia fissa]
MAPQKVFSSNSFGMMMMAIVLGSMTAVSAGTYSVKWTVPFTMEGLHEGDIPPQIQGTKLKVGDSLRFEYNSEQNNLLEVSSSHFEECNSSAPLEKWTDGNTTVTFTKPGEFYYIGGLPRGCLAGQFLIVIVKDSEADNVAPEPTSADAPIESSEASAVDSPIESPTAARNEIEGQESSTLLDIQPNKIRICGEHIVHNCPDNHDPWGSGTSRSSGSGASGGSGGSGTQDGSGP